eukprot:RCo033828
MPCSTSVILVFCLSAVVTLCASSLIAWKIEAYRSENADLTSSLAGQNKVLYISNAAVQLRRMQDFLRREVSRMRLSLNETRRLVFALVSGDPSIRTSSGALAVVNATLFAEWAHRVTFPEEQYGFAVNFLFPPDTRAVTSVQSLQTYADPLIDGGLQPIHAYTDPATSVTSAYQINLVPAANVQGSATGDVLVPVLDTSVVQYNFSYFSSAVLGLGYPSRFDILPWTSSDGNPWWFVQQSSWVQIWGVNIIAQSYASTVYWGQNLASLITSPNTYFLLFGASLTPLATSYPPALTQLRSCIESQLPLSNTLSCITIPLNSTESPPLFQFIDSTIISRIGDPRYFTPSPNDPGVTFTSASFGGQAIDFVWVDPILLEGPANEKFALLWFQFDSGVLTSTSATSTSAGTVSALVAFIIIVAVFSTVGVGLLIQKSFLHPLSDITADMTAVAHLEMDLVRVTHAESHVEFSEMRKLRGAFRMMAQSIQWFLLYLPRDVVKDILAAERTSTSVRELSEKKLTLIFCDIRGFTSATSTLRDHVDTFVELLQLYFEQCSNALTAEGCTIDKFIGDAIMGFWGAPLPCSAKNTCGCFGALALQAVVRMLLDEFMEHGWALSVRVGLHHGMAMVGSVGSKRRLNYTALGETVNIASRLEGLCNVNGAAISVSADVVAGVLEELGSSDVYTGGAEVGDLIFRRTGLYILKGLTEPITVYELVGTISTKHVGDAWRAVALPKTGTSRHSSLVSGISQMLEVTRVSPDAIKFVQLLNKAQMLYDRGDVSGALQRVRAMASEYERQLTADHVELSFQGTFEDVVLVANLKKHLDALACACEAASGNTAGFDPVHRLAEKK